MVWTISCCICNTKLSEVQKRHARIIDTARQEPYPGPAEAGTPNRLRSPAFRVIRPHHWLEFAAGPRHAVRNL